MNIYVGNLSYKVEERDLSNLFSEYGEVVSVKIITDKFSGRSKGFGFVEMAEKDDAENAIESLNEHDLMGRNIKVNEAKEREQRNNDRQRRY